MRTSTLRRGVLVATVVLTVSACIPPPSTGPGSTSTTAPGPPVVTERTVDYTCRASSLIGVQSFPEQWRHVVEVPSSVVPGSTFDIVVRSPAVEIPVAGGGAAVRKLFDLLLAYRLPAGVTVNAVAPEPPPGSDLVGHYVAPGLDPDDPINREEIPGGVGLSLDPATGSLTMDLPGTGGPSTSGGEFRAGSVVQPPHVRVNVTASAAAAGETLNVEVGGALPAEPNVLPWPDPSLRYQLRTVLGLDPGPANCAPLPGSDTVLAVIPVS